MGQTWPAIIVTGPKNEQFNSYIYTVRNEELEKREALGNGHAVYAQ